MIVHCLFEQSGTFRDEFRKLGGGVEAYDYDIDNQFGKTDFQIDLFDNIQRGYNGDQSIFDNIKCDDLIFAFFPCIRFSANIVLHMNGSLYQLKNYTDEQKLEYARKCNKEQYELYQLIAKLFIIIYRKNLRMIVENPYTQPQYLTTYFPIKPKIIDMDRTILGDRFKKPTQYWFVNIEPKNNKLHNVVFEFGKKKVKSNVNNWEFRGKIDRSLIEPKYAENFIKKYILNEKGEIT